MLWFGGEKDLTCLYVIFIVFIVFVSVQIKLFGERIEVCFHLNVLVLLR